MISPLYPASIKPMELHNLIGVLDILDLGIKKYGLFSAVSHEIPKLINAVFPASTVCSSTTNKSKPACDSYNNKGVQRIIEDNFDEDLYRDVNDIFKNGNSQRQFFSVPGNSVPNDRDTFMKWCYQTPPTCKEGNGLQCAANQSGEHRGMGSGLANGESG